VPFRRVAVRRRPGSQSSSSGQQLGQGLRREDFWDGQITPPSVASEGGLPKPAKSDEFQNNPCHHNALAHALIDSFASRFRPSRKTGEHIDVSIFTREKQFGTPESDLGRHRLIIGHDLVTCTLMHKVCKSLTPHGPCRRLVRILTTVGVAGAHSARMMHSCLEARQLQF
jgi:hypothetical protein